MKTLKHIGWFYLFYFLIFPLRGFLMGGGWSELYDGFSGFKSSWLEITNLMAFFAYSWTIYWILERYHRDGSDKKWFLLIPLAILGPIAYRYVLQEILSPMLVGFGNYHEPVSAAYYIKDNIYYAIVFVLFGVSYFYIRYSNEQQKKQFELSAVNRQLHLDHLRSQMNGHFLFNTLNGLYALFQMNDNRAGVYLEKLSSLFEYSLYEPNKLVSIEKELKNLQDFIDLQSLRTAHQTYIKIDVRCSGLSKTPQFILFPLIENAFKHGNLADPDHPAIMELVEEDAVLKISCRNLKADRNKDHVGGIGLTNLRKRITLLYSEQSYMSIDEDIEYFTVEIKIPLEQ